MNRLHFFEAQSLTSLTSGHIALEAAIAMGARELVLLGYDCRVVDGRSHCHADYPAAWGEDLYQTRVLPMWKGWGERMAREGARVINATPDSAIEEFPCVALDDVLGTALSL